MLDREKGLMVQTQGGYSEFVADKVGLEMRNSRDSFGEGLASSRVGEVQETRPAIREVETGKDGEKQKTDPELLENRIKSLFSRE